jgi:hypothetical protein
MISGWLDLIEGFDPSFADVLASYPYLTSTELSLWIASLIVWRLLFDRLERLVVFYTRRSLARGLFSLAVVLRPRLA